MNNKFLFAAIIVSSGISLMSCKNMTVTSGDGTDNVNGNGNIQSQNRAVSSFDKMEAEGVFNLFISQDEKESVNVETDENLLPLIITSAENNVLLIKLRENASIGKMNKINIYVHCSHLSKISTSGVGKLQCQNQLTFPTLDLDLKGVGVTNLNLKGEQLNIYSEIIGALILSGSMKEVHINHSGIGIIQAFELKTEKLSLDADGIGAAEVYASGELNINSKGLGAVRYKGNPQSTNIKNEGIGKVEKAD